MNSVRHGLSGRGLLLPGEDVHEYEERLDGVFASLAPRNDAEAEVVALVADDIHKLNRLARIEKGVTLGRIEELLAETLVGAKAGAVANAITVLGEALMVWTEEPLPVEKSSDFERRFRAMSDAVHFVEGRNLAPVVQIDGCYDCLAAARGVREETAVQVAAYSGATQAARLLLTSLLDMGHHQAGEEDELRAAVAGIALPDENELKKLARYRSMLEASLQRRLAALEQLRKLTSANVAGEKDVEKAREFRVRLRLVS